MPFVNVFRKHSDFPQLLVFSCRWEPLQKSQHAAGGLLRNSHSRAQELFVNTRLGAKPQVVSPARFGLKGDSCMN